MDEVARLIEAFGARGRRGQSAWKLDVLMDLGRIDDGRVRELLAAVASDGDEPADVREDALRRLRDVSVTPEARALAARAGIAALEQTGVGAGRPAIRLQAAIVLGDVVDAEGALDALGSVAADQREPIELRYTAFTALERAGPTAACLAILRPLAADEALGQAVRSLLASWRIR
jgi:hypothetical protein